MQFFFLCFVEFRLEKKCKNKNKNSTLAIEHYRYNEMVLEKRLCVLLNREVEGDPLD